MEYRLPYNEEAEAAVLGGLMLGGDPGESRRVRVTLTPRSFSTKNATVFWAVSALMDAGLPVDILTVSKRLDEMGELEGVGGSQYVASLPNAIPSMANLEHYASMVRLEEMRRVLLRTSESVAHLALTGQGTSESLAAEASKIVRSVADQSQDITGVKYAPEIMGEAMRWAEDAAKGMAGDVPYPAEVPAVTRATGGMFPGEVVVVQGATSRGKSAFLQQCWERAARRSGWALLCSNEMPAKGYGLRMWSAAADVDGLLLRRGRVDDVGWQRLSKAAGPLSELPLAAKEACFTPQQVAAAAYAVDQKARSLGREGLRWIGVDWLQLMSPGTKVDNDTMAIDSTLRSLKRLAMELAVPVVVVSQPDKASYKSGQSVMSGRGSGMIGMIANTLLILDEWDGGGIEKLGEYGWFMRIRVEKARDGMGRIAWQDCWFDAPKTRFVGLAKPGEEPEPELPHADGSAF